jgi:hypothetical protein
LSLSLGEAPGPAAVPLGVADDGAGRVIRPDTRTMEGLKQILLARLPDLFGAPGRVVLRGLPEADDIDGLLRLEGLLVLLAAHGSVAASGRSTRHAGLAIWLGGPADGLRDLDLRMPMLLWPGPTAATPHHRLAEATGGHRRIVAAAPPGRGSTGSDAETLPDPAHALWGLLDQHPRGSGILDLRQDRAWPDLLPAGRVALARRAERLCRATGLAWPAGKARQRLLESARRMIVAHAEVATESVGGSLFAALLGRPIRAQGALVSDYWGRWMPTEPGS